MPRPGFYNDNEYRAYPFIFSTAMLDNEQERLIPDSTIVDAGIIMGLDSEFDPQTHKIWLHEIRRVDNNFELELRTDAPGGENAPLIFTRAVEAQEWQTEYVESAPYLKTENSCAEEPAWTGFVVTGPLQDLNEKITALNSVVTLPPTAYILEPARIQSLVKHYLRSISVGNMSRPVALSSCTATEPEERQIIVNARCITGDIKLQEGYNCQIIQNDQLNEIEISAGKNLGSPVDGALCRTHGEIPFYDGEQPVEGSLFLSGGPACNELISTINGVGGPDVNIIGGTGINITTDQETNTITIELSPNNIAGNC